MLSVYCNSSKHTAVSVNPVPTEFAVLQAINSINSHPMNWFELLPALTISLKHTYSFPKEIHDSPVGDTNPLLPRNILFLSSINSNRRKRMEAYLLYAKGIQKDRRSIHIEYHNFALLIFHKTFSFLFLFFVNIIISRALNFVNCIF